MVTTRRIVVRVANAQGVSERRPADEARLALTKPGGYGLPDVVLFSEVSWLDVPMIARRHGFHAVQHGGQGSAEAGVAIAAREPLAKRARIIGSPRTSEGGGIRMRPFVSGKAFGVRFTAGHAPPPRSPVARALYIARARARRGVVGGDWNQWPDFMRRTSARKYRAVGVLGLLIPRRYKASLAVEADIGSDHPAVDVVLHIPTHNRRKTP